MVILNKNYQDFIYCFNACVGEHVDAAFQAKLNVFYPAKQDKKCLAINYLNTMFTVVIKNKKSVSIGLCYLHKFLTESNNEGGERKLLATFYLLDDSKRSALIERFSKDLANNFSGKMSQWTSDKILQEAKKHAELFCIGVISYGILPAEKLAMI
ncbi:MAG: hypothetical protein JKY13_02630, partial [Gammaproteobacteria bacterium]|nr:hypothetical protein [Gammaproteobacteria bacterium]